MSGPWNVDFLLFVLQLVKPIVNSALGEKFLMRSLFAQFALVEHENTVRMLNRTQPMRDHKRRAAREQPIERFANQQLGFRIHAGSRFIQNQKARIVRESPREVDELPLADGESRPALVDGSTHTVRE